MKFHRAVWFVLIVAACSSEISNPVQVPTDIPVTNGRAVTLSITPSTANVLAGGILSLTADVRDISGNKLSSRTVAWASEDTAIATVASSGAQTATAKAVGVGSVILTASVDGIKANVTVVSALGAPRVRDRAFLYSESAGMEAIDNRLFGASYATAINDNGEIAGVMEVFTEHHIFLWTREKGMVDLGRGDVAGFNNAVPTAINNAGEIVGFLWNAYDNRAFRWTAATGMVLLARIEGFGNTIATDINNRGEISGFMIHSVYDETRPVKWSTTNAIEDLGRLGKGEQGRATALNDSGQIAGYVTNESVYGLPHESGWAAIWTSAPTVRVVAGCGPGCYSKAQGISQNGQVSGTYGDGAFHWSSEAGLTAIGLGDGAKSADAPGVNSAGQVIVNRYYPMEIARRAYVWTKATGLRDIGALPGAAYSQARGINDKGQVVGYSR